MLDKKVIREYYNSKIFVKKLVDYFNQSDHIGYCFNYDNPKEKYKYKSQLFAKIENKIKSFKAICLSQHALTLLEKEIPNLFTNDYSEYDKFALALALWLDLSKEQILFLKSEKCICYSQTVLLGIIHGASQKYITELIKKYENDTFIIRDEIEAHLDAPMLHLLEGSTYNLYKSNAVTSVVVVNKRGYLFEKESEKRFYLRPYSNAQKGKLVDSMFNIIV